jgi:hypothetical protein
MLVLYKNDIVVLAGGAGPELLYFGFELGGSEVEELFEVVAEMRLVAIARLIGQGGEADIGGLFDEIPGVVEAENAGEELCGQADILEEIAFEHSGVYFEFFCERGDLLAAVLGLEGFGDRFCLLVFWGDLLWGVGAEVVGEQL